MLPVKPLGQPHAYGCLPTCVQAVRAYYGEVLSYDEASEMCDEKPGGGCLWAHTVTNLLLQYDVCEVSEQDEFDEPLTALQNLLAEEKPVIVELQWQGWVGTRHAVVVVEVEGDTVTVMNPAGGQSGRYETLQASDFLRRWARLGNNGFYFDEEPEAVPR